MITLATLPQATAQEVFDQVATHLLTQKRQALAVEETEYNDSTVCVYRNEEGLMCAAGCLIAKDEYDPKFEGDAWSELVFHEKVPQEHRDLIRELQSIHDGISPDEWVYSLESTAKEHKLNTKVLDKFK